MDWAWGVGMFILAGVPAIIGGGLVWSIFSAWTPVIVWEVILLLLIGVLTYRGGKRSEGSHH